MDRKIIFFSFTFDGNREMGGLKFQIKLILVLGRGSTGVQPGVATPRNSAYRLLDRDNILQISLYVRRAGFLVYKSLTPGPPGKTQICLS